MRLGEGLCLLLLCCLLTCGECASTAVTLRKTSSLVQSVAPRRWLGGLTHLLRGGQGATGVVTVSTKEEFDELQSRSDRFIVMFKATWCQPCVKIAPAFEEFAGDYQDITFCKVDVDANEATATACGVSVMPTFHFFHRGKKLSELLGADPDKLREAIADFNKRASFNPPATVAQ